MSKCSARVWGTARETQAARNPGKLRGQTNLPMLCGTASFRAPYDYVIAVLRVSKKARVTPLFR